LIQNYPIHIDIFSLFIFLGTVQGIFLSYFFLSKNNRGVKANIYLGLLLLVSSLLSLDILFSYTNFMFQVIYLVDATEPLNFLVGPLFFLYILAKVDESKIKKVYFHFIPAIIYFFYSIFFHIQSIESKYNAYIEQYHPELEYIANLGGVFEDPFLFKNFINELTIISILTYLILSIIVVYKAQNNGLNSKAYRILWADVAFMSVILFTIIFVKFTFEHDLGDYIIIVAISIFIYSISFKIIRESLFFKNSFNEKKYTKSALDEETKYKIEQKVIQIMEDKYYLTTTPSLPDLAKKINVSPNYVSQVINEKMGSSFLELINKYRIEEAKSLILDPKLNETIEGIGYSVGFNSKSTFHSAFKRITGQTPSEFKTSKIN
jgi:AraC-like DNA-binding protein